MDCSVSFIVMIRAVLFCSGECRVILDQPQASHSRLIFDGMEEFVNRKPQQSEMLFHFEVLGWIQSEDRECLFFVGWSPPVLVNSMG